MSLFAAASARSLMQAVLTHPDRHVARAKSAKGEEHEERKELRTRKAKTKKSKESKNAKSEDQEKQRKQRTKNAKNTKSEALSAERQDRLREQRANNAKSTKSAKRAMSVKREESEKREESGRTRIGAITLPALRCSRSERSSKSSAEMWRTKEEGERVLQTRWRELGLDDGSMLHLCGPTRTFAYA